MLDSKTLLWKVYDALNFLTKPMALPRRVIVEAAEAALKVIQNYYNEKNNETQKMD